MLCARALMRALNDAKNCAQQGCAMQFSGITLTLPSRLSGPLQHRRGVDAPIAPPAYGPVIVVVVIIVIFISSYYFSYMYTV